MRAILYAVLPLLLATRLFAVGLSDVHPGLTRNEADDALSGDYEFEVLEDMSVRRTWRSVEGNKTLSLDFNGSNGKLICALVVYDAPVSRKEGIRDVKRMAHYSESVKWPKRDMRKFGFGQLAYVYCLPKGGVLVREMQSPEEVLSVAFFPKNPNGNRRELRNMASLASEKTALGSRGGGGPAVALQHDEAQRAKAARNRRHREIAAARSSGHGSTVASARAATEKPAADTDEEETGAASGVVAASSPTAAFDDVKLEDMVEGLKNDPNGKYYIMSAAGVGLLLLLILAFAALSKRKRKKQMNSMYNEMMKK